jgi:hypothetical protein
MLLVERVSEFPWTGGDIEDGLFEAPLAFFAGTVIRWDKAIYRPTAPRRASPTSVTTEATARHFVECAVRDAAANAIERRFDVKVGPFLHRSPSTRPHNIPAPPFPPVAEVATFPWVICHDQVSVAPSLSSGCLPSCLSSAFPSCSHSDVAWHRVVQ